MAQLVRRRFSCRSYQSESIPAQQRSALETQLDAIRSGPFSNAVRFRLKNSHGYKYLQIVESKREGKKVKQRVLSTLG